VSRSRSTSKPRKTKPIVLPKVFADVASGIPQVLLTPDHTKQIQELVDFVKKNGLTELELEREGIRVRIRSEAGLKAPVIAVQESAAATAAAPQAAGTIPPAAEAGGEGLITITSPIVGTFYRSPSPDADPYVEEGDYVKKGQVLCIVEAMKLMNEIESETDGRVTKILAESTKPVEYGQPLFLIDPRATP
jgi:acetyl-CoA carboxylase biotin carboxyl carrier protein